MTTEEIRELIKLVAKTGVGRVEIERDDFFIAIDGNTQNNNEMAASNYQPVYSQPVINQTVAPAPSSAPQAPTLINDETPSNLITVKSTMIGTFYRSTSPDKDPFVSVGSVIQKGDKICIIEAMKLFNEIEAEVSGKIVKVLVDDSSPVEYDQPLFLVEP
jgi:acetyl-CoA carboxylase biotin carboxyl carrier protein